MPDYNSSSAPPESAMDSAPKQDSQSDTVLVDKSIFGGKAPEPGAKLTFEFVREYEDEAELRLVKSDESSSEPEPGSMEAGERELGAMAE